MRFSKPALPASLKLMVPEPTESAIDEGIDAEERYGDNEVNETEDECEDSSEDEVEGVEDY